MLVLAFRGTEKKLSDWKTDPKAELVPAKDQNTIGRIHKGFQEAYYSVESSIEAQLNRFPDCPLYVTGHSLGGALAVVATRFIDAGKLAACYTFGGPRVGDLDLARAFKTPIYRVVNASDSPCQEFRSATAMSCSFVYSNSSSPSSPHFSFSIGSTCTWTRSPDTSTKLNVRVRPTGV